MDKANKSSRPDGLVVWRILDEKAGHEAQSAGLVAALGRLCSVDCHDLPALGGRDALFRFLSGSFAEGSKLPDPDLLIGAGHRTHMTLLAARRGRGGRAVVLMKPSLPTCWFDLCLIPEHDRPAGAGNIFPTQGVLNTIHASPDASIKRGLILLGGPSAHYRWNREDLLAQLRGVVRADPSVHWILTTSRRTPEATEAGLLGLEERNLEVVPFAQTEPGWVAARLQECGLVWVSEDSVSMVYEALTAGARVGLLKVPKEGNGSRVSRGVLSLIESQRVTPFAQPVPDLGSLSAQPALFDEADRCARHILSILSDD